MTSFFKNGYQRAKKITDYLVDFIFPREALENETLQLTQDTLCRLPRAHPPDIKNAFALWSYKDPLIKEIVWQIKFYENEQTVKLVAKNLGTYIKEVCNTSNYLVLPIPISSKRLRERGFNQTEFITKNLFKYLPKTFTYNPHLLEKIKETKHQTGEVRKERLGNLKDSFKITDTEKIRGKNIILIDDVTTTGATFAEATRLLKESGAKEIFCFSIAH